MPPSTSGVHRCVRTDLPRRPARQRPDTRRAADDRSGGRRVADLERRPGTHTVESKLSPTRMVSRLSSSPGPGWRGDSKGLMEARMAPNARGGQPHRHTATRPFGWTETGQARARREWLPSAGSTASGVCKKGTEGTELVEFATIGCRIG